MFRLKLLFLFLVVAFQLTVNACTIVAVSGRATADGRPLLLKNRDSKTWDIKIRIGQGVNYKYLCQCIATNGSAYSGYNETGFAIINSHSYNMPNRDYAWNAYIMQMALERCASVDEFEFMLNTLSKPISVCANYGVMDAQGNVSIIEVNAYTHTRYNANDAECGYLIRTNYSFSQDTTGVSLVSPTSYPRYKIASSYLEDAFLTCGYISKEHLLGLSRCLENCEGNDLRNMASFDENAYTPMDFRYYVPRYKTTSMMIIEGVKTGEQPNLTVAWTAIGPPVATVTVPYLITPSRSLPKKAKKGEDGHVWLCYQGQMLKNSCFVDSISIDLAKLYNLRGTGVMQRVMAIEEEVLGRGKELVARMRTGEATDNDVVQYYAWVDDYIEEQYAQIGNYSNDNMGSGCDAISHGYEEEMKYYDILGRRVSTVSPNAIVKRSGNIGIIIN